jgi:hypothetical protein
VTKAPLAPPVREADDPEYASARRSRAAGGTAISVSP